MKQLTIIIAIILTASCADRVKPKSYYVVGKEYRQGGMCCDSQRETAMYMTTVVCRPIVTSKHTHRREASEYIIHIARPNQVTSFTTDSIKWLNYKCGQKIKY